MKKIVIQDCFLEKTKDTLKEISDTTNKVIQIDIYVDEKLYKEEQTKGKNKNLINYKTCRCGGRLYFFYDEWCCNNNSCTEVKTKITKIKELQKDGII